MKFLETAAKKSMRHRGGIQKPHFFDLGEVKDRKRLATLWRKNHIQHVVDDYESQLEELFQVQNPQLVYSSDFKGEFRKYLRGLISQKPIWQYGKWVFFSWNATLVHILPEDEYFKVRTTRNRNLINEEEQKKFYDAVIGIGGLSVGNSVALAIVLQGGAHHIKLADHDRLALSNTNRIRVGVENLGVLKVEMTARQIYAINPYATVELFSDGLTKDTITRFFKGPPKLNVVIDELDNLAVKYLIREEARKYRLPVIMAADNGDNGVVDIERYDLDPKTPFFHGRMGNVSYDMLTKLDKFSIGKMIANHIGIENVTERTLSSFAEMGKTIVSWPQLGGAALLNGSAVAYCVRKIVNNQPLEDNRSLISLDEKLIPGYHSKKEIQNRKHTADEFRRIFGF
ncbi:MAG: ThiF family adenylyltransferase [Patescibacteria group bacterium]